MRAAAALGLVLTAVVTTGLVLLWGEVAVVPGVTFGLLATLIQVVSAALVRPVARGDFPALVRRWGMGAGLRIAGVVAFAVAVALARKTFPPLPTALAYLGVVVPLLFSEIRFLR